MLAPQASFPTEREGPLPSGARVHMCHMSMGAPAPSQIPNVWNPLSREMIRPDDENPPIRLPCAS